MAPLPPANPGTASPFGDYSVRIDPWAVDYGGETPTEFQPDAEDAPELDLNIEQDVATWAPITPPGAPSSQPLSFVDGVRRMEARLVVTRHGRTVHGALGAYGVGVVECREGRATFAEERLGRVAIFGAGEMPPAALALAPSLHYLPRSVAEDDADAPLRGLHGEMRTAEGELARAHAAAGRIVIADGPLNIGESTRGHVVGFVKRLFKLYLPPEQLPVLAALPLGSANAGVPDRLCGAVLALFVVPADRPAASRSSRISPVSFASRCPQAWGVTKRSGSRTSRAPCCRASCRRARATRARRRTWCPSARSNSICVAASATPA